MEKFRKAARLFFLFSLFIPFVFLFAGACGQQKFSAEDAPMTAAAASPRAAQSGGVSSLSRGAEEAEAPQTPPLSPAGGEAPVRKLVKTAELSLRVEDPGTTEKPLTALMEKYEAWPASSYIYENSRSYSIRVPSRSYTALLGELASLGRLLHRSENTEDVTLTYYDLEGRLASKKELLATFRSYLGKAKDIEEIMTVEARIAGLEDEIERTGTEFRNLASLVDYSTINVSIDGPASVPSHSRPTLKERLAVLVGSFGGVASSALVVFTGIVVYGIPALIILILLFSLLFGRVGLLKKIWRFAAGKNNAAKEAKAKAPPRNRDTVPDRLAASDKPDTTQDV